MLDFSLRVKGPRELVRVKEMSEVLYFLAGVKIINSFIHIPTENPSLVGRFVFANEYALPLDVTP